MKKQEFKIGDKVRIIEERFSHNAKIGEIGTVCGFGAFEVVGVELKEQRVDRHDCRGKCHKGYGQWINANCLKKIADKKSEQPKIVITTDGTTTTAKLYENGGVVKIATSKCLPEDKFNFSTGAKYAFERLLGDVYPPEEVKKTETKKPKFKVGDKIKVIRNITDKAEKDNYIGKTYTIMQVYGENMYTKGVAYDIGEFYIAYEKEIELAPQLYNGKVVCVEVGVANTNLYTKGKIYQFVGGTIATDNGCTLDNRGEGYKSFENFTAFSSSRFIEIKE